MASLHESILIYRNLRYLKLAVALVAVSSVLYIFHSPVERPNGGTWLGYTLGTISAGIMLWLAWFGIRKRRYNAGTIRLEDWASAHVYLGLALVILSTLHSGFQFGINIHTLFYALMIVVVLSGIVGLYFYMRFPRLIAQNRRGLTTEGYLTQIADLDRDIRNHAMLLDDSTLKVIQDAVDNTRVGGGLRRQLAGVDLNCPTTKARQFLEQNQGVSEESGRRQVLSRLTKKEDLLRRLRRDIQLRCLLQIWLYVHVPFTFAMMAALIAHIVTVFFYW